MMVDDDGWIICGGGLGYGLLWLWLLLLRFDLAGWELKGVV